MSAVRGKAEVQATWPGSPLLAKNRHSGCRAATVSKLFQWLIGLGIIAMVLTVVGDMSNNSILHRPYNIAVISGYTDQSRLLIADRP